MATSTLRVNVGATVGSFASVRSPGSESPVSCPSSPSQFFGKKLQVSSPREMKSPNSAVTGARAYTGTAESRYAPPTQQKNLYDFLGVSKNATPREIKAAYRMAALRLHPDVVPEEQRLEATKSFLEVQESYSVLSNPETRAAYDLSQSMTAFRYSGFSNRGIVKDEVPAWGFTSSPTSFSFKGHNWETDQCW